MQKITFNFDFKFQSKFDLILNVGPAAYNFIFKNPFALELAQRSLAVLDDSALIDIGLLRKILLNTKFAQSWKEFEDKLMEKLKYSDIRLKDRVEKKVINLGQTKNWIALAYDQVKQGLGVVIEFFKNLISK